MPIWNKSGALIYEGFYHSLSQFIESLATCICDLKRNTLATHGRPRELRGLRVVFLIGTSRKRRFVVSPGKNKNAKSVNEL
ncbi:hypothetical protein CUU66_07300 [Peribacillus deserti]|uniref:Uncharacterized protein n=1 Tax=Peribacillus deserti TaxID=673318 RepID=A0A2N5M7X0_9BACI|nr:hypothetical protein CUU66_07300 [Peribacillus deserti]